MIYSGQIYVLYIISISLDLSNVTLIFLDLLSIFVFVFVIINNRVCQDCGVVLH